MKMKSQTTKASDLIAAPWMRIDEIYYRCGLAPSGQYEMQSRKAKNRPWQLVEIVSEDRYNEFKAEWTRRFLDQWTEEEHQRNAQL